MQRNGALPLLLPPMKSLATKTRNAITKEIKELGTYHTSVPVTALLMSLKLHGVVALDEDNTEWRGFVMGENSSTILRLAELSTAYQHASGVTMYQPLRTALALQWYKISTKFEINAYLS
jgi:hypothetical protein